MALGPNERRRIGTPVPCPSAARPDLVDGRMGTTVAVTIRKVVFSERTRPFCRTSIHGPGPHGQQNSHTYHAPHRLEAWMNCQ